MKKAFALILACVQLTCAKAQPAGTVVTVGFDNYDNRNLYGLLQSEENGVINFRFFKDNVFCSIDREGNVLAGSEYINRAKPGKPIGFIQIEEKMKWIGNPQTDIDKSLGVFMLIVTKSGDTAYADIEYNTAAKSFKVHDKTYGKYSTLQFTGNGYTIIYSDNPKIPMGNTIKAVYLYPNHSRRFYTRKN